MKGLRVRSMRPEDWPAVRRIFEEGIATGDATFETEPPSWEQWDTEHLDGCRLVAQRETKLLGWAALSSVSSRACYRGVAEVSVYVAASSRGEGVGRALLERLVEEAEAADFWTLQAGIFPENQASLRLHERCGFRRVGVRERMGRLAGRWRDVVLMERRRA